MASWNSTGKNSTSEEKKTWKNGTCGKTGKNGMSEKKWEKISLLN